MFPSIGFLMKKEIFVKTSKETFVQHFFKIVLGGLILLIAWSTNVGAQSNQVCRLNEARDISCAAAKKSYEINRSWPGAQGVFEINMRHLGCVENIKWDGVCR